MQRKDISNSEQTENREQKKEVHPDSFFGARTSLNSGKTSFEMGSAGPVIFTTKGPEVEFARVGHISFTDKGPSFRW